MLREMVAERAAYTALTALALFLAVIWLCACEAPRSYEREADGSILYFDQISDAAKVEARRKIADGLDRGFKVYELGVGDEIEVFFRIERKPTSKEYVGC